jgi:hypothetical protein
MNSDTESRLFDFPSVWREVRSDLLKGHSVLLSAPRHFGKNYFSTRLSGDPSVCANFVIVFIDPEDTVNHGLAFKKMWKDVAMQLALGGISLTDGFAFEESLLRIRSLKKILFVIRVNFRNKTICIKLLNFFQQLSHNHPSAFMRNISMLVLDDLSLYFYELAIRNERSFYDIFESRKKIFQYADIIPINNLLKAIPGFSRAAPSCSNIILQYTGGHLGLIYSLLSFILADDNRGPANITEEYCRNALLTSSIIDSMKRVLLQGGADCLEMALSFKEKKLTDMVRSETNERLHQAGILLRVNSLYSVLCPGVVCELTEELYAGSIGKPSLPTPLATNHSQTAIALRVQREVFFSYAHGRGQRLIDQLYIDLSSLPDIRPVMDKKNLPYRESISTFMMRIGEGNFVVVAFSDKYLKSKYCMFEFYELYRNSSLDGRRLIKKIFPIRIGKLALDDLAVKKTYFDHWEEELDRSEKFIQEMGGRINTSDFIDHERIKNIHNYLGELLEIIKDIKSPDMPALSKNNFALIKEAILGPRAG